MKISIYLYLDLCTVQWHVSFHIDFRVHVLGPLGKFAILGTGSNHVYLSRILSERNAGKSPKHALRRWTRCKFAWHSALVVFSKYSVYTLGRNVFCGIIYGIDCV